MPDRPENYTSYLLRVWRVREFRDAWRVSLENAQTHEVRGFASLAEVFEFLDQSMESERDAEERGNEENSNLKEA